MLITLIIRKERKQWSKFSIWKNIANWQKKGKQSHLSAWTMPKKRGRKVVPAKAILKIVTGTKTHQFLLKRIFFCLLLFTRCRFWKFSIAEKKVFSIKVRSLPWSQKWNIHNLWSNLVQLTRNQSKPWGFHQYKNQKICVLPCAQLVDCLTKLILKRRLVHDGPQYLLSQTSVNNELPSTQVTDDPKPLLEVHIFVWN